MCCLEAQRSDVNAKVRLLHGELQLLQEQDFFPCGGGGQAHGQESVGPGECVAGSRDTPGGVSEGGR